MMMNVRTFLFSRFKVNGFAAFFLLCAILFLLISFGVSAKPVLRRLDLPYLSNNAVLYIYQDRTGNMWFGTYDGLNLYNGKNTFVYRYEPGSDYSIDGNIIRHIIEGGPEHIWVSTIIGLNRISIVDRKVVERYPQYPETHLLTSDSTGNTLVIALNDFISYHAPGSDGFHDLYVPDMPLSEVKILFADKKQDFYLLTNDGLLKQIKLNTHTLPVSLTFHETPCHTLEIKKVYYDKAADKLFFVDIADKLYIYDMESRQKELVGDLSDIHIKYADMSCILMWDSDIYISYISGGLIKLEKGKKSKTEYSPVEINAGVFNLCKDENQNILWIGTDGKGVHMSYEEDHFFKVLPLEHLPYSTQKPVRGIYTDEKNTLWVATKGEGVFCVRDYDSYNNTPFSNDKVKHYTARDGLANNQVFCFLRSRDGRVLWMGSEGPGLSYFSYNDNKIYNIETDIRWVHSICEINDTTLWLATAGNGLIKIVLDKSTTPFSAKNITALMFEINERLCNNFHSMVFDGDSSLIAGIRGGYGAISFNMYSDSYQHFSPGTEGSSSIGDVLCVYPAGDSVYYLGSSSGLTRVGKGPLKQFNIKNGIANDMIHGILGDEKGCLWLSTNRGLTKYNPENDLFHNFYHPDLNVTEFSDDAYWKCPYSGRLFFGGINGLVWLEPTDCKSEKYTSELRFLDVSMDGEVQDLLVLPDELIIPPHVSSFKVSFIAINYINGDNYEYAYWLDGYNTSWVSLQKNNEVSFTNLPYGRYTLYVKHKDDVFDDEIKECRLSVYVKPPWYLTGWAIAGYIVLFLLGCASAYLSVKMYYERKQKIMARRIREEQKEKLYESKLNFFTNITHELCTPLTLINGITENIKTFKVMESEEAFKKNVGILQENVQGLNELIQEILDFRKIEEGGFSEVKLKNADVSRLVQVQSELFLPAIEKGQIHFSLNVPDNLYWQTDVSAFKKIFTNILSNAFKYVSEEGDIRVSVEMDAGNLVLSVYNTGKGIDESQARLLFDRFRILGHMDENDYMQMTARNGLGLFICHSLVQLLKGEIKIKSEVDKYAEVTVILPPYKVEEQSAGANPPVGNTLSNESGRPTVLIVDDNKDIVWLITNTLVAEYDVREAFNASDALQFLKNHTPALIITDIIMPGMDGLKFVEQLKSNKFTRHIPVVIISAKISDKEQAEGLNLGADAYLTKPFSPLVLQSTVNRLLSTKKDLKKYYYSPESAYEMSEGQLLHEVDKTFMESVTTIIHKNLDNENLRSEWIAGQLGLSSRNFYRRFKKIASQSPSDFIKDCRFTYAAQLLITTDLSIQEIIYKVGINNKSYFYREFFRKYQTTPKKYRQGK